MAAPKFLTTEPVLTVGFLTSFTAAVFAVLKAFNVYSATDDQTQAVLTMITALAPLLAVWVRSSVVPVVKVEPTVVPRVKPIPPPPGAPESEVRYTATAHTV